MALGVKVKDVHCSVCRSLAERYSSGATPSSRDDNGDTVARVSEQQVIEQFNAIRPLYDQLEQVRTGLLYIDVNNVFTLA